MIKDLQIFGNCVIKKVYKKTTSIKDKATRKFLITFPVSALLFPQNIVPFQPFGFWQLPVVSCIGWIFVLPSHTTRQFSLAPGISFLGATTCAYGWSSTVMSEDLILDFLNILSSNYIQLTFLLALWKQSLALEYSLKAVAWSASECAWVISWMASSISFFWSFLSNWRQSSKNVLDLFRNSRLLWVIFAYSK